MKINRTTVLAFFLTVMTSPCWAWMAGFASEPLVTSEDLTDKRKVFLAGYGVLGNREASGIHDDVFARSLYLSDGKNTVLIVSLDAVGYSQTLANRLRTALASELQLPEENILLSATHTHSSIDLQGIWGSIDEKQADAITNRVVKSGKAAAANSKPARLMLGLSNQGKGYNRRLKSSDIIPQVLSLNITGTDGKPIALLFSFGSHPVALDKDNLAVTSDWVNFSRNQIEKELGTKALFINGSLGDVLPSLDGKPNDVRTFEFAEEYGDLIARTVIQANKESRVLNSHLAYCREPLPLEVDNLKVIALTKGLNNGTIDWTSLTDTTLTTTASVLVLDKLVIMSVPGEPVTQLSQTLMAKVPDYDRAIFSLTHDSLGYLIPEDDVGRKDGYEETFNLNPRFGTELSNAIDRLLKQCLGSQLQTQITR
ncbi:neutral/alkaline non-lysosomal ceramidase N-terminal domain-containing protein [Endozoicomonas arenosclerae]|uniref:neutral/alkaline non-lysosomal ceramidase N-terminal domain-containing protein n=1 Tax=Endozoicomonas arenosclerae TaxID=1633495 RepID=UPI0009A1FF5A|nr:neutral/alkaline non-lysosomal ceramidase N-terminal domain-containing protein [Endozoicomonas arenosclerae]